MSNYNAVIPSPEAFQPSAEQHPLKRKFEPVLLDRYPRPGVDTSYNRMPFPEYVPMFAFPNDIGIVSSDTRPQSTWHEFSMTAADNSKIPAVCVIVWIPVNRQIADKFEQRCEEWRRAHMSDAEREMAASLAERLALESAKLSRLLSQLPQVPQGSYAREELEEEISAVEEKINLMSDMLKPLRHGTSADIQGLAEGDRGLWIPRAFGLLGRDSSMTSFWRSWLRAVVVPMTEGAVLRVPASSPKVGMWQPLERYVSTLCMHAPRPVSSKVQVEVCIRELHLYAKKEAVNELPGSRTTDLYPLFRALTIPNVVLLMEYVLAESRIILLSTHTAMLQLVAKAILDLLWPLEWAGVYIPVLPSRLVQALDAPCPYICGIERRYERYELPDEDFVLVDLDKNELYSTDRPPPMPKEQRKKLISLLHLAAPHHHSCGVSPGPPAYVVETFPYDGFAAENESVFTAVARSTNLSHLACLSSASFGSQATSDAIIRAPTLNVFLAASPTRGKSADRPRTASTRPQSSQPDSDGSSLLTGGFPPMPGTPTSRNDSGYTLQTSLREKRSGHFDSLSKRAASGSLSMIRRPSLPFSKHSASLSTSSIVADMMNAGSTYAPSTYAQSTLAASTVMPGIMVQPARNTDTTSWIEGHCLEWRLNDGPSTCVLCDEKAPEGYYRCSGCGFVVHGQCASQISIVCPAAFYPDQIRAAFARCFASLFYHYRRFLQPIPTPQQQKRGALYSFDYESFIRSLPMDQAAYIGMLKETQAFNEFIAQREQHSPSSSPSVALFDAMIMAKRNRSGRLRSSIPSFGLRRNPFTARPPPRSPSSTDVLSDTSSHQWRIIATPASAERAELGAAAKGRDYHDIVTRIPAKLEDGLMKQEEKLPDLPPMNGRVKSAALKGWMNGLSMNAP